MIDYLERYIIERKKLLLCGIVVELSSNFPLEELTIFNDDMYLQADKSAVDYKIVLCKCDHCSDVYRQSLFYRDGSVRNACFNRGYYVCDHYGEPINMIREHNTIIVFGLAVERILWSYLVKYILQIWSLNNNALFVKCAAFANNNRATVLIGRGASGKTVINTVVCKRFGTFITNSNAIIRNGEIIGLGSNIRVRRDKCYDRVYGTMSNLSGLSSNDLLINPYAEFNCRCTSWIPIKNFVVVNYTTGEEHLERISREQCLFYADLFLLGLNVYRLEEDVLDYLNGNCLLFSEHYKFMKDTLIQCIDSLDCYYANVDITNSAILNEFMEKL